MFNFDFKPLGLNILLFIVTSFLSNNLLAATFAFGSNWHTAKPSSPITKTYTDSGGEAIVIDMLEYPSLEYTLVITSPSGVQHLPTYNRYETFNDLQAGTYKFELERCVEDVNYNYSCEYNSSVIEITLTAEIPPEPTAEEAPSLVGNLPYIMDVNSKGEATLGFPLDLLPGVAGFKPALSINYNSGDKLQQTELRKPSRTLGYGWYLSGLSEIRRCKVGKNQSYNIQLSNSDNLCIDDQPLTLISGSHLSSGALYRTQIHSNILVEAKSNNNVLWFEAKLPNGTNIQYGNSANSQVPSSNATVYQWSINQSTDVSGNKIQYTYVANNDGTNHISEIEYDGAKIIFDYIDNRTDQTTIQIGSSTQTQTSLLKRVEVKMNNVKVREYHLNSKLIAGKNLLDNIQLCGYVWQGNKKCLPPTRFTWETSSVPTEVGAILTGITDSLGANHQFSYKTSTSAGTQASFSENPFMGGIDFDSTVAYFFPIILSAKLFIIRSAKKCATLPHCHHNNFQLSQIAVIV
ncbi:SpvB/TcaC N-terminal domain-containing protein [Catenovulum sediminis]|uniref:SpvB/TcaC N-terminal domain-containing protein n=1 Tax=Catenovulum sediminis TaxID=1740262 RepID=A0ABV1RD06_9ALTE